MFKKFTIITDKIKQSELRQNVYYITNPSAIFMITNNL